MGKKTVYTRQETCELLGISEVTFTAWVRKGLLKKVTSRGAITVTAKSVDAILDQGNDVAELTTILERERKKLQNAMQRLKYEKRYHNVDEIEFELKQFLIEKAPWLSSWTKKAANILIPKTTLSNREKAILLALFGGGRLETISQDFQVTRERARQIAEKALRRLDCIPELFERQEKKISELTKRIAALEVENRNLAEGILKKKKDNGVPEMILLPKRLCSIDDMRHAVRYERAKPLIPIRALNILPCLEVENVYQLIWLSPRDLLSMRNFGKKALTELSNMFEEYGLRFNSEGIDSLLDIKPLAGDECVEVPTAQLEADMLDTWKKFRKTGELGRYKARVL